MILLRDPELSREAPPIHSQAGYTAAKSAFLSAVQDGRNEMMRSERGAGRSVTRHLRELSEAGAELLFKAMHEAKCGRANLAAELLRDCLDAEASDYADNEEGAYL